MGYYIEVPKDLNKAQQIVDIHGGTIIPKPSSFAEVPADQALICVVGNGLFDAAGIAYDEREFEAFSAPDRSGYQRPRTWVLLGKAVVCKLCPQVKARLAH